MLKKNYCYRLLKRMFELFDYRQELRKRAKAANMTSGGTMGLDEGFAHHLKRCHGHCARCVEGYITAEQVKACWRKTTLVDFDQQSPSGASVEENEEAPAPVAPEDEPANEGSEDDIADIICKFAKGCGMKMCGAGSNGDDTNYFEAAVMEMALTSKESGADSTEEIMENVDEWVSMEDNDFCHEVLAAEVLKSSWA